MVIHLCLSSGLKDQDQAEEKPIGYKSQRGGGVWQGWTNEQTEFLSIPQGFAPNGAAI